MQPLQCLNLPLPFCLSLKTSSSGTESLSLAASEPHEPTQQQREDHCNPNLLTEGCLIQKPQSSLCPNNEKIQPEWVQPSEASVSASYTIQLISPGKTQQSPTLHSTHAPHVEDHFLSLPVLSLPRSCILKKRISCEKPVPSYVNDSSTQVWVKYPHVLANILFQQHKRQLDT